jgi:hypothetical protein
MRDAQVALLVIGGILVLVGVSIWGNIYGSPVLGTSVTSFGVILFSSGVVVNIIWGRRFRKHQTLAEEMRLTRERESISRESRLSIERAESERLRMNQTADEIVKGAISNPLAGKLLLQPLETVKFVTRLKWLNDFVYDKMFLLTDRRYLVSDGESATVYASVNLASIMAVSVAADPTHYADYEYLGSDQYFLKVSHGSKGTRDELYLYPSRKASVQKVADALTKLVATAQGRQALEQKKVNIVLDFSSIREYLDKGGFVLTTVKCPQCGAGIELPKEGNLTKCQHCGSQVYAQDVFDKLKGLLSK